MIRQSYFFSPAAKMTFFATGNNSIDSLVFSSWAKLPGKAVTLTYSFMTAVPADGSIEDANGFAAMSVVQQQATRTALAAWAAVANIKFTEVVANGDIQLGTNNQGNQSSGYALLPNGGDSTYLFLNNEYTANSDSTPGSFGPSVLLHELGHTLGFKHPGDYNSTGGTVDGPFLPKATDTLDYTVMSYNDGNGHDQTQQYSVTPMLYDIQAIQYLYGANMSYHAGGDSYKFSRSAPLQCIWDAGGNDTFDFSGCSDAVLINLNAGTFSSTAPGFNNISIAYNVTIEAAIAGSGGSTIYANASGNVITGGAGADVVHAGAGSDRISGGSGTDTVVFASTYAHYILSGTTNSLQVKGDGSDTLSGIETLQFSDRSIDLAAGARFLVGSDGADSLLATAGNDYINGGSGTDTVVFGTSRSNYTVSTSNGAVVVTDTIGSGGQDTITGIERLVFSTGNAIAFDTGDHQIAGEAYRLYQAAFNRLPDLPGLGHWIKGLESGLTLWQVASSFVTSDEFVNTYGPTLTQAQYVNLLYSNVLHRVPAAFETQYYVDLLDTGKKSRADVLVDFSESAENQAALIGAVSKGVDYVYFG